MTFDYLTSQFSLVLFSLCDTSLCSAACKHCPRLLLSAVLQPVLPQPSCQRPDCVEAAPPLLQQERLMEWKNSQILYHDIDPASHTMRAVPKTFISTSYDLIFHDNHNHKSCWRAYIHCVPKKWEMNLMAVTPLIFISFSKLADCPEICIKVIIKDRYTTLWNIIIRKQATVATLMSLLMINYKVVQPNV